MSQIDVENGNNHFNLSLRNLIIKRRPLNKCQMLPSKYYTSGQILQGYGPFELFKVRSMRANYRGNQRSDNSKFKTSFTKNKYSCLHFYSNLVKLAVPHNNFPFCLLQQHFLKLKYILITPYSNR